MPVHCRRLGAFVLAVACSIVPVAPSSAASAHEPSRARSQSAGPVPGSMAALGDSITRGRYACGFFIACVAGSWSTGWSQSVHSHFRMIESQNPAMEGNNHNDAADRAHAADLPGQAQAAVDQGVDYVTTTRSSAISSPWISCPCWTDSTPTARGRTRSAT